MTWSPREQSLINLYKVSSTHGHEGSAEYRMAARKYVSAVLNQWLRSPNTLDTKVILCYEEAL